VFLDFFWGTRKRTSYYVYEEQKVGCKASILQKEIHISGNYPQNQQDQKKNNKVPILGAHNPFVGCLLASILSLIFLLYMLFFFLIKKTKE